MNQRHLLWAAFAAALALTACGGSDSPAPAPTPAPAPSPSPAPAPAPTPAPAPGSDRIEPLDTAVAPLSAPAKVAPAALSRLPAGATVARVALGPLAAAKQAMANQKGVALKIGEGRDVSATASAAELAPRFDWRTLADGSQVAAVAFAAEGARGIRLGVLAERVPAGTVLRFYGAPGSRVVEMSATELEALRRINEDAGLSGAAARMVWGPDTEGAVSTLEVQLPPGVSASQLRLAVPQLSHLTQTVAQAIESTDKDVDQIGNAGSCNVDVMCSAYQTEGRAVAKMLFSKAGSSFLCTGTLLNDTRSSRTPYFLTAAHCISDQAAASTLVTYWFFRAQSCGSSPRFDPAATPLGGGAQLLYTRGTVDSTLLRLNAAPPANVLYAGSYFGGGAVPGTEVLGVHHPSGDLQKFSLGSVRGYISCTEFGADGRTTCVDGNESTGALLGVSWRQGTTEGGSSGSAIFVQPGGTRYVAGVLSNGSASCQNPSGTDNYGRFQRAFADGIGSWLTR